MSFVVRRPHLVLLYVALALITAASAFGQCGSLASPSTTATAGTQDFNTAADWSNGAPTSSTNACIINSSTVNLAAGATGNVLNLEVDAGNTLNLQSNSQLNFYGTQIINGGAININSTGNYTLLVLYNSPTLSGTGTLTLQSPSIIEQGIGGLTLTNQSTIQGSGTIGNGGLALANSGTIDANDSTAPLLLNGSGGITNTGGTLEATAGGTLNINSSVTNGNILANGGTVNIEGSGASYQLNGVTLTNENGGTLQTYSEGYAFFNGVTIASGSTYTNGNDAYLYTTGTINNQGTLNITAGADSSVLWLNGSTTFSGGGTVNLSGTGVAYIEQQSGGLTLTNQETIAGAGIIGNGGLTLANQGTINANLSGQTLTLNGSGNITNTTGLLEATSGGTLNIANSVTGGTILANGGTVNIEGSGTGYQLNGVTLTSQNGGTLQTITGGYADFNNVTLTAGSTYTNGGTGNPYLYFNNTIANNGTINIAGAAGAGQDSYLWISNNVTLTGSGTLELSTAGAGTAYIAQQVGGLTLTNQSTIAGAGIIGNGGLTLANQSTVNANLSGQTLELNGSGGVLNTGTLEATNGGILEINGTTVNNSGGMIQTDSGNGSVVQLMGNGTIQGGTLSGNFATINTDNFYLDGATHGAVTFAPGSTYNVDNDSFLYLQGSIVNNGAINLNGGASNNTVVWLQANTTLSGTGTLTLANDGGTAYIEQQVGGVTLTNQSTIQGTGVIGNGGLTLANQAIVDANVSGQTLVLNGSGGVVNTATLEATNGGILEISGATVNNSGGTISTNTGGLVQLMGDGVIQGGTLSGNFETINTDNFYLDGATHGALTFAAGSTYNVDNDSFLYVQGSIVNNGAINLNGGASNNTVMWLQANTTLSGTGTLTLANVGGTAYIEQQVGGLTLTNQSTIQGTGVIGNGGLTTVNGASGTLLARNGDSLTINGSGGLTNNGTMQVNAGGTMTVTSALSNFSGGTLTGGTYIVNGATGSTGVMQITSLGSGGGEITTNAANITLNGPTASVKFEDNTGNNPLSALAANNGSLTLGGGYGFNTSAATLANTGVVTVGTLAGDGSSLSVNGGAGTYTQTGGTTTGTGTIIAANSTINGGTLLPGAAGSPGTFTFTGNLAIGAGGSLTEGINGAGAGQFGVTNVSGTLNINGSAGLEIVNSPGVLSGATPIGVGAQLTIMTSSGLTGGFTNADITSGATFNNNLEAWTVAGVGNNEVLNATANGVITATFNGSVSNSWTGTGGSAPSLTSNWTCSVPIVNFSGNDCVPNNGNPIAGTDYNAVINSGNATLASGSPTVNNVQVTGGSLTISNATLNVNGSYQQSNGVTEVDGAGNLNGSVALTGGTLQGSGGAIYSASVSGTGTLLPGTSGTPGSLTFNNNLSFSNGGTLDETINGTAAGQFGTLSVLGTLNTSASGSTTLDILDSAGVLNGTTVIAPGTIITIAASSTPVLNQFNTVLGTAFDNNNMYWQVLYNQGGDNIELQAESNVVSGAYTATWSTASNNWTNASAWTCNPALNPCVPNNGTPAGDTYAAILNSSGNTLTLNSAVTVNSVDVQSGSECSSCGLSMNGGSVTATNSFTIEANGAVRGNGTITSPSFSNNATASSGGVYADLGTLNLSGSTIDNYNSATQTLTGGVWQAGLTGAGTLELPGDIATNSALYLVLNNPGSQIVDASGHNALANTLTSNNGGVLDVFDGASLTLNNNFTNGNGSAINVAFGGGSPVSPATLTIGGNLTNSGGSAITVNGNFGGAALTVTGDLTNQDTSTVLVNNGGVLGIGGNLNLQGGTITVTDAAVVASSASQINVTGNVTVGAAVILDPTLQIQNGAGMTIGGNLNINPSGNVFTGNAPSDSGHNTLTVHGAINNAGGLLELEGASDSVTAASLTNSGTVTILAPTATLAVGPSTPTTSIVLTNTGAVNDSGSLNLSGAFSNTGSANLSILSGGAMTVDTSAGFSANTNSATISVTGSLSFVDPTYAGPCPGSCNGAQITGGGTINMSGGTLSWASNMFFESDNAFTGNGTLSGGTIGVTPFTLLAGGTINPTGLITINSDFNNFGAVTVSHGNALTIVGGGGIGSTGSILVNGGTLSEDLFLDVGIAAGAAGTLTVNNSGTANITGDLNVAQAAGSNGIVSVTGAGSLLTVGGNVNTDGSVTTGTGGTLSVTGDYNQNAGSTDIQAGGIIDAANFFVNGGTAEVDGSLTATAVSVANGAELTGNGGTITGNLVNDGTLSPGTGAEPGILTVNGNINLSGATGANDGTFLELIAGLNNFGILDDTDATGVATLGGTLEVELLGGYQPVVGNTFTFIDPFSDSGAFTTLDLPAAPAGDEYMVEYNPASVELCLVSTADPVCGASTTPPPVPEPKSLVLLGTVVTGVMWIYRKRRQRIDA